MQIEEEQMVRQLKTQDELHSVCTGDFEKEFGLVDEMPPISRDVSAFYFSARGVDENAAGRSPRT